jgi:hypothetical protein
MVKSVVRIYVGPDSAHNIALMIAFHRVKSDLLWVHVPEAWFAKYATHVKPADLFTLYGQKAP